MFIYFICAILVVQQCEPSTAIISPSKEFNLLMAVPNKNQRSSGVPIKTKRDVLAILNPLRNPFKTDEDDPEESISYFTGEIPKITIWEFPTERRVFIDDEEIFINSQEDSESESDEHTKQQSHVLHHHKKTKPDISKEIINAKEFPKFRPPAHKKGNKTVVNEPAKVTTNNSFDEPTKFEMNREKRNTIKREIVSELNIEDEALNIPKNNSVRTWRLLNYLKSFLRHLIESKVAQIYVAQSNQHNEEESGESERGNESSSSEFEKVDEISESVQIMSSVENNANSHIDISSEIDERIFLLPIDPELLKSLLEEFRNEKKRFVDPQTGPESNNKEDDINNDNEEEVSTLTPIAALVKLIAANNNTVKILKDKSDAYLHTE